MGETRFRGRVLALDVGDRRIGLAISDEESLVAGGLPTLERATPPQDVAAIARLAGDRGAAALVLGLPINMSGTLGPQARKVLKLQAALQQAVPVPVLTWDERLTTVAAERAMDESGLSRRRRRQAVDRMSAQIILEGFLDYLHTNGTLPPDAGREILADHDGLPRP